MIRTSGHSPAPYVWYSSHDCKMCAELDMRGRCSAGQKVRHECLTFQCQCLRFIRCALELPDFPTPMSWVYKVCSYMVVQTNSSDQSLSELQRSNTLLSWACEAAAVQAKRYILSTVSSCRVIASGTTLERSRPLTVAQPLTLVFQIAIVKCGLSLTCKAVQCRPDGMWWQIQKLLFLAMQTLCQHRQYDTRLQAAASS